ncbi:MAG TPA: molybdenum cofactor biosynthesis protein [Desulfotomaculum sp.]|nr:MAG: Molybdenum cofactor synthesis domain protein [Desulfotomaculum sp. 46_80]HAG10528.1 molybdenum cofactor biosynthesis protein [Desulfotomaculum sp.]HBY04049.1 molybdenum cofactor biosynthesis protein [Desulfotomaculum sp.]
MYSVGILTASDKGSSGKRDDLSGAAIREFIEALGWKVKAYLIVPDDLEGLEKALLAMCDEEKLDLIFTTGGTGFSPRDNTPEATKKVIEKEVPGIPEIMRLESSKKTPQAMLSRATAGIRKGTLIINLPGSIKAVKECLDILFPTLIHGMEILTGRTGECGG